MAAHELYTLLVPIIEKIVDNIVDKAKSLWPMEGNKSRGQA